MPAVAAHADPLHVVVMALLGEPLLRLEAEDPLPVLAQLAVHQVRAAQGLLDPLREGVEHGRVIVEVRGLDELQVRMPRRGPVGMLVDPLDEHAGEEEVREDDDAPVAEARGVREGRIDEGKGDPGVGGLPPAEPEPFPQEAHHLGDVAVGVRVGRPAPDDDEHGLVERDLPAGRVERGGDPVARGAKQLLVDPELAGVADLHLRVLGLAGVQHRRDVVLGMARREQHPGDREAEAVAPCAELVEPFADHRGRELQEPALDVVPREPLPDAGRDRLELRDGLRVAAPVAAHHHPDPAHAAAPPPARRPHCCAAGGRARSIRTASSVRPATGAGAEPKSRGRSMKGRAAAAPARPPGPAR